MSNADQLARLKKAISENPPRAYDLSKPDERLRLLREVRGYLHTCRRQHHGTDMEGRWFAIEAVEQLINEFPKDPRP